MLHVFSQLRLVNAAMGAMGDNMLGSKFFGSFSGFSVLQNKKILLFSKDTNPEIKIQGKSGRCDINI